MSYTKITTSFKDHETVLTAAHLQHMESGIADNDAALGNRVRTDTNAQGLGTSQKRNARSNIDAPSTAEMTAAVAAEADLRSAADAAMETKTDGIQEEVALAKEDISDLQAVSSSMVKTKTVNGNHLTIKDALAGKAKKLVINLEPKQNLNGYSKPWIAGSGKNLASPVTDNSGWSVNVGGSYGVSGDTLSVVTTTGVSSGVYSKSGSALRNIITSLSGQYTWSIDVKASVSISAAIGVQSIAMRNNVTIGTNWTRINGTGTFSASSNPFVIYNNGGTAATIEVRNLQFEPGDTATDYEPYENICPIEGFDMVQVLRTNNNLVAGSFYNVNVGSHGLDSGGNQFSTLYARVKKGQTYVIVTADSNAVYGFIDELQISSTSAFCYDYNDRFVSSVFVASDGRKYQVITAFITGWLVWRTTLATTSDCAIYEGTQLLDDYSQSQTLSFNLVSTAGSTVYGGTVTVNEDGSGTLVVDRGRVTIDNFLNLSSATQVSGLHWADTTQNVFDINVHAESICSMLADRKDGNTGWGSTKDCFALGTPGLRIYTTETTNAAFREKYKDVQITYGFNTPLVYQLTATQLQTLVGTNHIWTDGTSLELDYRAEKYSGVEKLLAAFPKKTVTGNPASFTDGADGIPVESLTVTIEPKQDLHGYTHPWVGGAGKNLLNSSLLRTTAGTDGGLTVTPNGDGTYNVTGTATSSVINVWLGGSYGQSASTIITLPAGTYTVSQCALFTGTSGAGGQSSAGNIDGTVAVFTLSAPTNITGIRFPTVGSGVTYNTTIKPMLVAGSYAKDTLPAWEPYENICPITGWDTIWLGENLYHKSNVLLGKNWINQIAANRAAVFFQMKKGAKYNYHLVYHGNNNLGVVYGENAAIGQGQTFSWNSGMVVNTLNEHTVTNTNAFFQFQWNDGGRTDPVQLSDIEDWEIIISEVSENDTFQTIPVKSISGSTVYGGKLTIKEDGSGELVVDSYKLDLGSLTWNYESEYLRFYCNNLPNNIAHGEQKETSRSSYCISDSYECLSNSEPYNNNWNGILYFGSYLRIYVHDHNYTDATTMKTALSGKYVVYPIAPQTYPLTAQEVNTLLGANHITCDAGQVTVTYRADPSLLINKLQTAMTAYGITV